MIGRFMNTPLKCLFQLLLIFNNDSRSFNYKRYWETALFTFSFLLFRKFFGGYHAKTHIGCISILVIMYLTMIFMIRLDARLLSIIAMIICSLSIIPVLLLSPVSHPNNPIDKIELKCTILSQFSWFYWLWF